MNNTIYEPPKSDLGQSTSFKRSIAWKIYFVFYIALSILGFLSFFFEVNISFVDYISIPISIFEIVGLFGFCFLKPIYKPKFWFFIFMISLIYYFSCYFIVDMGIDETMSEIAYYTFHAIVFILYLPTCIALYLYSKTTDPAWGKNNKTD